MREYLVGTWMGRVALAVRDRLVLILAAATFNEEVGTLFNDQLASLLASRLCQDGGTFIDVGAHIGSVTDAVRRNVRDAKIIAIEPIPKKAARLRAKFPGIEVHECAVGSHEEPVEFFVDLEHSGYSSLRRSTHTSRSELIRVPMRKLDSLVARAHVIKIDVEGAELGVLQGATTLISNARPVIVFESAPPVTQEKQEMWNLLDRLGYQVFTPDRVPHCDPPLSLAGFLESHEYPRRTTNYIAVYGMHRQQIREKARRCLGI